MPTDSDLLLVEIWTDGGCKPNPGPGGWAAILVYGETERALSGAARESTNNRMELTAAAQGLEALKKPCRVILHTDSQYVERGITVWKDGWLRRNWRTASGQAVLNRDLWERLFAAAARHRVEWRWVRGHAGDERNQRADALAAAARSRG